MAQEPFANLSANDPVEMVYRTESLSLERLFGGMLNS